MTYVEKLAKDVWLILRMVGIGGLLIFADGVFGPFLLTDSSDAPNRRSGLSVHVDHLTGCHYFGKGNALTPRLDRDGRQICAGLPK